MILLMLIAIFLCMYLFDKYPASIIPYALTSVCIVALIWMIAMEIKI